MKVSVITPVNDTSYLNETYDSLVCQSEAHWEWVLVPNGGAVIPDNISSDRRVKVVPFADKSERFYRDGRFSIGALKRFACAKAMGDVIVELDADDLLVPDALEKIENVFTDDAVVFAYSNDALFESGTWKPVEFGTAYGWESRTFEYSGHTLTEMVAWDVSPQALRKIWWSPDHVRAWRAGAYRAIGGHNIDLFVGDDYELILRFYETYGARGFAHIDEVLYLYRVHDGNSSKRFNDEIQSVTRGVYLQRGLAVATRWAKDNGLRVLDLGGRLDAVEGFETVDLFDADVNCDLNEPWPFEDDSVGVVRASHVFEHLRDPIHVMNELYRVLAAGGFAFIEVPSTDGRGAFQDPTHVSFWNENSFWYYTRAEQARYIPQFTGRFQVSELMTYYPTEWWQNNHIPVVRADLIALKDGYDRPAGEVLL